MLKTILLGVIQGLAEFLPISSSGHLVLFQNLLNMPDTGLLLEILLHVGTLFSVFVVFWKDFMEMLLHLRTSKQLRLLIVSTIPTVIVALLFEDAIDAAFGGAWFLGVSFLITSLLLSLSDVLARRSQTKAQKGEDLSYAQAAAMGVMQAFAILPGVSRSGSTIVGGLFSGVSRKNAAHFSFLMSAVATGGSLVFKLKDLLDALGSGAPVFDGGWSAMLAGMLAAAVSGYLATRWMLALIQKISLKWFGLYTGILGLLVISDQLVFHLFF